jgi:hypothetical protein
MTNGELKEFLILRQLEEPVSQTELERTSERSTEALEIVRDDGHDIDWVQSRILENGGGEIVGTLCHYRADSEDALYEHAECAGLPVTQVYRRGNHVKGP